MTSAFGDIRTLAASDRAKDIMRQLVAKNLFDNMRHVWTLGAALGISSGNENTEGNRGTFQNINSLDPDGIFAAILLGKYPELSPEERRDKLVNFAEWGIREIYRKEQNSTLIFSKLG